MPVPHKGETEDEFIGRCIPIVIHEGTTKNPSQAAAICYSIWRRKGPNAKKVNKAKVTKKYYSTAKPYYRFELPELKDELTSIKWLDKKLLVDIKADGLRLSIGRAGTEPFAFVDPELLKKKSPDVSHRLPEIMKELNKAIPPNTVLDAEFIAVKGDEVMHRTTSNAILNATHFSPEMLAKYAYIYVFDCLFFNGEDIRDQPLHERLEYLHRIKSTKHIWIERLSLDTNKKSDAYIVSSYPDINKAVNKIINNKIGRPKFIAEGVMIKDLDTEYQHPINHGWGKAKKYFEVDAVVWDKKLVKGQDDVWNYFLGINVSKDYYEHLPNKIKVPNKYMFNYGKTDNSKVKAKIGDVLRVASEEVLKVENEGYPYYRGYINRVLEPIPEKHASDSLDVLEKLSRFQPKRIPMEEISRISSNEEASLNISENDIKLGFTFMYKGKKGKIVNIRD